MRRLILFVSLLMLPVFADGPLIVNDILDVAKKNDDWKSAFSTLKSEQVVFMNISPKTNPQNEIGEETHAFDQVILIVSGEGKAILDGKTTSVRGGTMIFVPEGTKHNVINYRKDKPLKLISFYSQNDIPAGASYPTKSDAH